MSYSLDVNLLLYSSDASSPHHARAREFLESCASRMEVLCVAWPTIMGYLRIATHPAVFGKPLSPEEALQNVDRLITLPQVRVIAEEEGFWTVFQEAIRGLSPRGNLVPDCHLAALLKQHEVRILYTNDSDFRRFTFLEVRNPLLVP